MWLLDVQISITAIAIACLRHAVPLVGKVFLLLVPLVGKVFLWLGLLLIQHAYFAVCQMVLADGFEPILMLVLCCGRYLLIRGREMIL